MYVRHMHAICLALLRDLAVALALALTLAWLRPDFEDEDQFILNKMQVTKCLTRKQRQKAKRQKGNNNNNNRKTCRQRDNGKRKSS